MKKLYDNDQERRKAEQENDKDHSKPKKRKGGKKGRGGGSGNSGGDNLVTINRLVRGDGDIELQIRKRRPVG